jgi:hypothetical protein
MFPYFMKEREKIRKRKNMKKKFEHREMIRKKVVCVLSVKVLIIE